jgi:DNA-binding LytR/AlgR family response regulator
MKVLIVEDDPFIAEDLRFEISTRFPSEITDIIGPALNYADAVSLIHSSSPDLIMLDISLGDDKDAGIRLAHFINQHICIPIIFLSGLPKQLGFDQAKFLCPFDFIHKPFDPDILAEKIELAIIYQSQRKNLSNTDLNPIPGAQNKLMVTTGFNEITAIPVSDLILLEADDKIIRAFTTKNKQSIDFTSPGLKNFYQKNLFILKDFHRLNRKHVFNLNMVHKIKNNHILLPKIPNSMENTKESFFQLPIPKNGDSKKLLYARLGYKN